MAGDEDRREMLEAIGVESIDVLFASLPPATTQASAPEPPTLTHHTLRVGRVNDIAYAQADDDPYVFELDPTVYRVLTAELIDPKLFDVKPELVNAVTIPEMRPHNSPYDFFFSIS